MISRERLAREYINVIYNYYPIAGQLLHYCLVKVLNFNSDGTNKHCYYLGVYYPEWLGGRLLEQQDIFKDAAENMGLIEVVFLNANHLVKDPRSKIKHQDFRFWLELCWIAERVD
ncbi:hypothetical protein [Myxosarcina sp. GI1(2024)]